MTPSTNQHATQLDLMVRLGCKFVYHVNHPTPAVFLLKPKQDIWQSIRQEALSFPVDQHVTEEIDDHGNTLHRVILQPGQSIVSYDAMVAVPSLKDDALWVDQPHAVEDLPMAILRYTFPSRYCDSDKLLDFAAEKFGHLKQGLERVLGILDWLHHNIEYRQYSGDPTLSAHDVITRGYGVCRDFAQMAVALCRAFSLPARYVSGYVPDIDFDDSGTPMDFHAYMEVYMAGRWQVFDARFLIPRVGRVRIATGYDAVNGAFSTYYGGLYMSYFHVWSYQIDPNEVKLGDEVDLSKRLCGKVGIKYPPRVQE